MAGRPSLYKSVALPAELLRQDFEELRGSRVRLHSSSKRAGQKRCSSGVLPMGRTRPAYGGTQLSPDTALRCRGSSPRRCYVVGGTIPANFESQLSDIVVLFKNLLGDSPRAWRAGVTRLRETTSTRSWGQARLRAMGAVGCRMAAHGARSAKRAGADGRN